MKKYKHFIKESQTSLYNSMSDEELNEKLEYLITERDDINNEIASIRKLLYDRQGNADFLSDFLGFPRISEMIEMKK
jgi:hypothetical protein